MLKALLQRWRSPPVATADGLTAFLDQRAALVAQKSVIGYCHVKTKLPLSELITEKAFADAFEISRSEAFAAVLADLVVVAEGVLRPNAVERVGPLGERLAGIYAAILDSHPKPSHRPEGWASEVAALRQRLLRVQLAPPASVAVVARVSAERVFDTLPIHERLRAPDQPAVIANVQFLIVGLYHEFEKRLDHASLVADLLAPKGEAA